jgi:hypothetical protein
MRIAGPPHFMCPARHLQLDYKQKMLAGSPVDPHIGAGSLRSFSTAGSVRVVEPCSRCWLG